MNISLRDEEHYGLVNLETDDDQNSMISYFLHRSLSHLLVPWASLSTSSTDTVLGFSRETAPLGYNR